MATNWKVTFRFRGDVWGWAETYYWTDVSVPTDGLMPAISLAAMGRRTVLANNMELASISVGKLPLDAASTVYYRELNAGVGLCNVSPCTMPWAAILTDVVNENKRFRRQMLTRGWPDVFVDWSGLDPAQTNRPVAMWSRWKIMRQGFGAVGLGETPLATGWGILARAVGADFLRPPRWPVKAIANWDACGTIAIAVPTAAGYSQFDKVHITGLTDCSLKGMNGDLQLVLAGTTPPLPVAPTGTSWWVTSRRTCCEGTIVYNGRGSVYKIAQVVVPWAFWDLAGVRNRQTGKPAHTTRGRARKRRCCS